MALNRRGNRVNSIIDDLTEAVELSSDNVKVFCLLGKCYEMKKIKSEAKAAFKEALKQSLALTSHALPFTGCAESPKMFLLVRHCASGLV
ncbi:hypothetical protein Gorai_012872 [Gossypium raimondii]|uniref:Uncharacterized protein n=1 Tax=Gossypium raimondii TaxID=29730 RepID=A0A7J8Q439_GOSRA|nr:hypothetical protein [Gossypium raimondii]